MERRCQTYQQAGFTLVEVLVVLVLLSLISTNLFAVCSSAQLWVRQAGTTLRAGNHAHAIIEYLRGGAMRLNSLPTEATPYTLIDNDTSHRQLVIADLGMTIPDPSGFEEKIVIDRMSENRYLYKTEVSVQWEEGGRRRSITVSSLLSAR